MGVPERGDVIIEGTSPGGVCSRLRCQSWRLSVFSVTIVAMLCGGVLLRQFVPRAVSAPSPARVYSQDPASRVTAVEGVTFSGKLIVASATHGTLGNFTKLPFSGALPQYVQSGGMIYFAASDTAEPCTWSIWRSALGSAKRTLVLKRLPNVTALAVNGAGGRLAYVTTGGGCNGKGVTTLTITSIRTGRSRVVHGVPLLQSLAWTGRGGLIAQGPEVGNISAVTRLMPQATTGARFRVDQLPCPRPATACAQFSPEYDASGRVYYVAAVDPNPKVPCAVSVCQYQRYVLTQVQGRRARTLFSVRGSAGRSSWCSPEWNGTGVVFTVPGARGGWRTFYWNGRRAIIERTTVSEESFQ
jgi:hypothetical protein